MEQQQEQDDDADVQQWKIKEDMISVPTQRLGSGKFGRVFETTYQGKPVALKRMKHGVDPVFFFNEIRMLSLVQEQHDHIPILYGYVYSEHKMGILMEKVEGISLSHFICFHEFGYKTVLRISKQIISTLRYVHSRHILYRDVKTENIMIHPRSCHVHFVDFGLAHLLSSPTDMIQGVCGTPGYMAPEIMENKYYGMASDIFSCGVVLYVLSTLHDPSTPKKMRRRLSLKVRPPLRTMIIQCLSYHPKKRPTLYEMEHQLMEMIDNHSSITTTMNRFAFLCLCKAWPS